MTSEEIIAVIEAGMDNYDGPDGASIDRLIARALIEAGVLVDDCGDDEWAVAEYVSDGLPFPWEELGMTRREVAVGVVAALARVSSEGEQNTMNGEERTDE